MYFIYIAMKSDHGTELTYDEIYRLLFHSNEKYVYVYPFSTDSFFHEKIITMKISYSAVDYMIKGNFQELSENDIALISG